LKIIFHLTIVSRAEQLAPNYTYNTLNYLHKRFSVAGYLLLLYKGLKRLAPLPQKKNIGT